MTKGRAAFPFRFDAADGEQQVPPLRYAPVGMTLLFGGWDLIRRIREGRWAHCRSLGFAPPDFLWELWALSHFMRLSLTERRTRGVVQRSVAGNPGRDDKGEGGAPSE